MRQINVDVNTRNAGVTVLVRNQSMLAYKTEADGRMRLISSFDREPALAELIRRPPVLAVDARMVDGKCSLAIDRMGNVTDIGTVPIDPNNTRAVQFLLGDQGELALVVRDDDGSAHLAVTADGRLEHQGDGDALAADLHNSHAAVADIEFPNAGGEVDPDGAISTTGVGIKVFCLSHQQEGIAA